MTQLARATQWCNLLALRLLLTIVALAPILTDMVRRRWSLVRRSGDAGVESVEIAVGLASGLALALMVYAAARGNVTKWLSQLW